MDTGDTVLVIDDDGDGREAMADSLRLAGYTVRTASNGQEGLDALREIRPVMILLDVHMPVMDGPHFRQIQRQSEDLIGIPTVVMTADATQNPVLDMAVEHTIRKPIARRDLLAIVARYAGTPGN